MILKRLTLYFGIVLLVTACYQYKKPEKPKNLISKDKMVGILIDVKLITSANGLNKIIMNEQGVNNEAYIFNKHNIDSLQFALSNQYYAFNIKEYEEIYEKVKDSLEQLKDIYKKIELKEEAEEKAQKKKDSINNVLFKGKDSLTIIKIQDSLKTIIKKEDSLTQSLLKNKFQGRDLISPVSDTDYQSQ
ncbi:MAG: DUF4296 domain-containing protein [Flavobacteriaceae bacterium]